MNTLKVLDVTLRDGGCVNNFNLLNIFSYKNIQKLYLKKIHLSNSINIFPD